jgi:hypothetical protein
MGDVDARSRGVQLAEEPARAVDMDLRERIYEILQPTDWTAEATEPSGAKALSRLQAKEALTIILIPGMGYSRCLKSSVFLQPITASGFSACLTASYFLARAVRIGACACPRVFKIAGLTCTLRGYQRRALAWMAQREAFDLSPADTGAAPCSSTAWPESFAHDRAVWNGTQHPCWQRIRLPSGQQVFHNWCTGKRHNNFHCTFGWTKGPCHASQ